jgi:hypothetical protein
MTQEKIAKECLRYLFTEYLKAPTVIYTLAPIVRRHKLNAVEFSDFLLGNGWIRERWIYPDDTVGCRITVKGIEEVEPVYVREKLGQLIGGLVDAGGAKPLLEILEFKIAEYAISLDIVNQLDALGLVVIHHPKNSIVIEITDSGRKFYERNGRAFMTLMSV